MFLLGRYSCHCHKLQLFTDTPGVKGLKASFPISYLTPTRRKELDCIDWYGQQNGTSGFEANGKIAK